MHAKRNKKTYEETAKYRNLNPIYKHNNLIDNIDIMRHTIKNYKFQRNYGTQYSKSKMHSGQKETERASSKKKATKS